MSLNNPLNICYFTQKCLPIKHILILPLSIPCHPQIFNSIESFKRMADMIEFTKRAYRTVSIKGHFTIIYVENTVSIP